jgi:hypothetical protein
MYWIRRYDVVASPQKYYRLFDCGMFFRATAVLSDIVDFIYELGMACNDPLAIWSGGLLRDSCHWSFCRVSCLL